MMLQGMLNAVFCVFIEINFQILRCFNCILMQFFLPSYIRLTFWLSNTVVLREIISQTFGTSGQTSPARFHVSKGSTKSEGNAFSRNLKGNFGGKQVNKITTLFEDWEETSTFTFALEKIESWIFSRVVESVWWQVVQLLA